MDIILTGAGCFVAGVLFAAWRLRGEGGMLAALKSVASGGPRPTVPK